MPTVIAGITRRTTAGATAIASMCCAATTDRWIKDNCARSTSGERALAFRGAQPISPSLVAPI